MHLFSTPLKFSASATNELIVFRLLKSNKLENPTENAKFLDQLQCNVNKLTFLV